MNRSKLPPFFVSRVLFSWIRSRFAFLGRAWVFFTLVSIAQAQMWAPMPTPAGTTIPVNATTDSIGNSYSISNDRYSLLKTTNAGLTTVFAMAPTHFLPNGSVVHDYLFTDLVVAASDVVYAAETPNSGSSYAGELELIFKLTPMGVANTVNVAGTGLSGKFPNNCTLTVDVAGNVFTVGIDGSILELKTDGTQLTVAPNSWFYDYVGNFIDAPQGLSVDAQGNLYTTALNLNPSRYVGPLKLVLLSAVPVITFQPQGATIRYGTAQTLTVTAASAVALGYQWYLDGFPIAGAAGTMGNPANNSVSASYEATLPGTYQVRIFSVTNSVISSPAVVTTITNAGVSVVAAPTIITQPTGADFGYGGSVNLAVAAISTLPISYQWQINGSNLAGATGSTYSAGASGAYRVVVTTTAGSLTSDVVTVSLANRPANISSRAAIGTGGAVSIAGFVIASYSGNPKSILIRAAGPALTAFGVADALAQPVLSVFDANGQLLATNTGWNSSATIANAAKSVGAFAFSAGSQDSALLLDLAPGPYTAQVSGVGNGTGVGLVEVYELSADSGHFVNISTRASVGVGGKILIGGLVLAGTQPSQVLVRALGPALLPFGVSGALAAPVLSIYDLAGKLIAVNVGWSNGGSVDAVAIATAATKTGAFPLQPGSADSALLLTLAPGSYTAQVSGVNDATGIALVEVYQVPQ